MADREKLHLYADRLDDYLLPLVVSFLDTLTDGEVEA